MNEPDYSPAAPRPNGPARVPQLTTGMVQQQAREASELRNLFTLAIDFPRVEHEARALIVQDFSGLRMAEVAQYQYQKGGTDIAGPSIHAAQSIAGRWGNIDYGWRITGTGIDPDTSRHYSDVMVWAIDLQTRVTSREGIRVEHWRDTKAGGYPIREAREVKEIVANMAQRTKRSCLLHLIPQDVIDEAMEQANATLAMKADTSPEGLAKMVDTFKEFGVTKAQLEAFIQRKLEAIGKPQVVALKRIFVSLRDGLSMPLDWFPPDTTQAAANEATGPAEPPKSAADKAKEALKARTKAKTPPPPAEAPAAAPAAATEGDGWEGVGEASTERQQPGTQAPEAIEPPTAEELRGQLMKARDRDAGVQVLDSARHLSAADIDSLAELLDQRFPEG